MLYTSRVVHNSYNLAYSSHIHLGRVRHMCDLRNGNVSMSAYGLLPQEAPDMITHHGKVSHGLHVGCMCEGA